LATAVQAWIGVIATLLTAIAGVYLNYKSRRDRIAEVGNTFASIVGDLSTDNEVKKMAAAVLMRRFFDERSELAVRGVGTPYRKEAVEVIAGMLREPQPARLQKVLADSLRYAVNLQNADLQNCILSNGYLGQKDGDEFSVNLSGADLFEATCERTSFRNVTAVETVFYRSKLQRAVFNEADLRGADFREAELGGAKFSGAKIGGARFAGALNIPDEVASLLDAQGVAADGSQVGK
jgi:Pentapeptide repeats (9 copies)